MPNKTLILVKEVTGSGNTKSSPLNARFDEQLLIANIRPAELRWVQTLLGRELYEDMIADSAAETNPPTVPKFTNVAYQTLWDLDLQAFCAFAVVNQSLPDIAIKTGSNGLIMENTSTGDNAGVKGMQVKQDSNNSTLQVYREEIAHYLCTNIADFPLYKHCSCKCGENEGNTGNRGVIIPTTCKMKQQRSRNHRYNR